MKPPRISEQCIAGLNAAWKGLRLALVSPRLRRSYLGLTIAIMVIALLVDIVGIFALWHWTSALVEHSNSDFLPSWMASVLSNLSLDILGLWLLRIVGLALLFLLAPILAFFIVNFAFPFFNDSVFLAGMDVVAPSRGIELANQPGQGTIVGVLGSLRRIVIFLVWSLVAMAVGFVPVIGPPVAAVLQFWCTIRATVWELLDPYFDRSGLSFSQQMQFLRTRHGITLAFGGPWMMVLAIPLIGPAFFGVAQAATAKLVWDMEQLFEQTDRHRKNRGST